MTRFLFASYSLFLLFITLFSYLFIDPNLSYLRIVYTGFSVTNRLLATGTFVLLVIAFFVFYLIFISRFYKKRLGESHLRVLVGLTAGILFFSYPAMLSFDIFNYIATAKVLFFYHENPFIVMPIEFIGDPLLGFMHAANKIALYGPVWIAMSGLPYILGFGNFLVILFNFKLFILLFYLAIVILIYKMSRNIFSTALFALNPLVLIESFVGAHNDIVMMFFVLFSFFLLARRMIIFSIVFFLLSLFIKYATLLLLPVFIFLLWKTFKKEPINWEKVFYASFVSMFVAFLLSPIREEIYPWYAIWFLPFVSLISLKKKTLIVAVIALTLGLLLRYAPFIFSGTYFGSTPAFKIILTLLPIFLTLIWLKVFSRLR